MSTLHILSHSPFSDTRFYSCLRLLASGDALLLTGDATYAVREGSAPLRALLALEEGIAIYALDEDLMARAVDVIDTVKKVDYPGFVQLCTTYQRVNSW